MGRGTADRLLAHLVLLAATVFVLFPYAWMLVTSIKPIADVSPGRPLAAPRVTLENYAAILGDARFLRSLFNSAVVSIAVTVISLVLSVPAAYGLTRLVRGGGRRMLSASSRLSSFRRWSSSCPSTSCCSRWGC